MSGDHNMNQKFTGVHEQQFFSDVPPSNLASFQHGVMAERQRIVNLLMIQHESAKERHNYWKVAAELIQADVASNT